MKVDKTLLKTAILLTTVKGATGEPGAEHPLAEALSENPIVLEHLRLNLEAITTKPGKLTLIACLASMYHMGLETGFEYRGLLDAYDKEKGDEPPATVEAAQTAAV